MSANTWYLVSVPLSDLGAENTTVYELLLQKDSTGTIYYDEYKFISTSVATSTTRYMHSDHLGGTNVVTNTSGAITQTLDYYPYGSERISTGSNTTDRRFIGERYDQGSGLNYLNARYYKGTQGQFLSQDPVFWEIGLTKDGNAALANPQAQNSYSYAEGNPIMKKDPLGRCAWDACVLELTAPIWGPYVIGAAVAGAAALYFGTAALLRNTERYIPFNQQGREVQVPKNGMPDPNTPDWQKLIYIALTGGTVIYEFTKPILDLEEKAKEFINKIRIPDDSAKVTDRGLYWTNPNSSSPGYYKYGSSNGTPSSSSKSSTGGGSITVPNSNLPRTKDPVGIYNGAPVYCWGAC